MATQFKALLVEKTAQGDFTRSLVTRTLDDLPQGELVVKVHYSSLNYKDALSATGHPGVTKEFPHTPGIDAAGTVVSCSTSKVQPGEEVFLTSFDLGMETDGGFGQYIRVPCRWAQRLPEGLSLRESMILGTAGLTAGQSVSELIRNGVAADSGPVLVTGATGGVGSMAVAILGKLGYEVVAVTGKPDQEDYLKRLGASRIISRETLLSGCERPLMKPTWAGVVDCVGGDMLVAALKSTRYDGAVTSCGLVASAELNLNVYPFILRAVHLAGIDSAECPMNRRQMIWNRLAREWKPDNLEEMCEEVGLAGLDEKIEAILKGQIKRRVLVNLLAD